MSFDTSSLFASVVIGLVGLSIFLYGKKQRRAPQLVAGPAAEGSRMEAAT
jgi:hypothetical protein